MTSNGLPVFPSFSVHVDQTTTAVRWKKWIDKLKNVFAALDIDNDKKRKATLLHFAGDEVFNIFHNFTDQQKGIGATTISDDNLVESNEYEATKKSLTNYFMPQKNILYKIFKFHQAIQNLDESLDLYHVILKIPTRRS